MSKQDKGIVAALARAVGHTNQAGTKKRNLTARYRLSGGALIAMTVGAVCATASFVEGAPAVYVAGSSNAFGTLNLTTGAFTSIGTLSLTSGAIYGMGFGSDGNLYGLSSTTPAELYRINTDTAATTDLGPIGQSAIDATADANGLMYGLTQGPDDTFYTVNPPSLTAKVVGVPGIDSGGLAAVTADGSHFYASDITSGTTDDLASINVITGAATDLGNMGFDPANGLFVQGTLFGFSTTSIYTVNTTKRCWNAGERLQHAGQPDCVCVGRPSQRDRAGADIAGNSADAHRSTPSGPPPCAEMKQA